MNGGPFTWGSNGRRMTPEDITRERQVAQLLSRPDYSPVGHWMQGLARVSGNLVGGLRERRADRASEANMSESDRILAALTSPAGVPTMPAPQAAGDASPPTPLDAGPAGMSQVGDVVAGLAQPPQVPPVVSSPATGGAAPSINPAVLQAMTNPYVSDEVRQLARMQYQAALQQQNRRAPEPPEIIQLEMIAADPSQPANVRAAARAAVTARNDPQITAMTPDRGMYVGPASQFPRMAGQGGATAPAPPPTLDPDYFDNLDRQGGPQARPAGEFP